MHPYSTIVAMATAILLSACQDRTPLKQATDATEDMPGDPVTEGLDKASLSALLNSEMALRHGHPEQAAHTFISLSERYDSRELAARAIQAARQSRDSVLLNQALDRWSRYRRDDTPLTAQDADIYRLLADSAITQGEWRDALKLLLTLDSAGHAAHITALAESLLNVGNAPLLPLANMLDRQIRRFPDHADPAIARALLTFGMGHVNAATAQLTQLRQHWPNDSNVLFATALIQQHRAQWRDTLATAQQGLDGNPNDLRFALLKLRALFGLDDAQLAEQTLRLMLDRATHPDDMGLVLAKFLLECRQPDQALTLLASLPERTTLDEDKEGRRHSLSGLAAEMKGDMPRALAEYQQVTPDSEPFVAAQVRQFQLVLASKGLDAAVHQLQQQCDRYPTRAATIMELVTSILDQNRHEAQADAVLDEVFAKHPDDDDMRFLRAMRAVTRQDMPNIERDMLPLLQRHPDNPYYLNAYGYSLTELTHRYQEALPLLKKAFALAPKEAAISDSLGWTFFQLDDLEQAQHYLELAHQQNERDADIACHLIEVYARYGRLDQARMLSRQVQQMAPNHPELDALIQRYPELAP